LMLAQRSPHSQITGIEMEAGAIEDCTQNFNSSPFRSRLKLQKGRVQDQNLTRAYDLVVSNPPFFSHSTPSQIPARHKARHRDDLSFNDLAKGIGDTLRESGNAWILIPISEETRLISEMNSTGLYVSKRLETASTPQHRSNRLMLSFQRNKRATKEHDRLFVYDTYGIYSERTAELLKDFYLRFAK
jgi:tRNA1Val (adenine37-N6)-methyltransferase